MHTHVSVRTRERVLRAEHGVERHGTPLGEAPHLRVCVCVCV